MPVLPVRLYQPDGNSPVYIAQLWHKNSSKHPGSFMNAIVKQNPIPLKLTLEFERLEELQAFEMIFSYLRL